MSVYFITDRMNGVVKIGYSNAPKRRLAMLRTSSFYNLKLEAVLPGSMENERQIQRYFSRHHIKREWFKIADDIEQIISMFPLGRKRTQAAIGGQKRITKLLDVAGSQSALARSLGTSQQNISNWLAANKPLPAEFVLAAENATGISRHLLRPDIYPKESA